MSTSAWQALAPACRRADLSIVALHLRYVALGGVAPLSTLTAHLASGAPLSAMEHDVAVHAINERFLELDDGERVPYEIARGPR